MSEMKSPEFIDNYRSLKERIVEAKKQLKELKKQEKIMDEEYFTLYEFPELETKFLSDMDYLKNVFKQNGVMIKLLNTDIGINRFVLYDIVELVENLNLKWNTTFSFLYKKNLIKNFYMESRIQNFISYVKKEFVNG